MAKVVVPEIVAVHDVLTPEQARHAGGEGEGDAAEAPAAPPAPGGFGGPGELMIKALLIEDDRKLAALLVEFLGQHGVEATIAADSPRRSSTWARVASTSCSSI